jgi:hypothetical protein
MVSSTGYRPSAAPDGRTLMTITVMSSHGGLSLQNGQTPS